MLLSHGVRGRPMPVRPGSLTRRQNQTVKMLRSPDAPRELLKRSAHRLRPSVVPEGCGWWPLSHSYRVAYWHFCEVATVKMVDARSKRRFLTHSRPR